MTNAQIQAIALAQAAADSGCRPEDFLKTVPVIVRPTVNSSARRYLKLPFFLDLTTYGSNIVAVCVPEMEDFVRRYIDRPDIEHCFETPALYDLNAELEKYNHRIRHMAEYYLPDTDALASAVEKNRCGLPVWMLNQKDFAPLYRPEWSNALCADRAELDVLGAAAFDGDTMVGFAACSADGEDMWQIGIDVLPAYRRQGIAKALVTRLACEILERGKVPFYCAAWSNVKSARCAIASGFVPSWSTITAKPLS